MDLSNTIIKCNDQSLSFTYKIFNDGVVINLPMPNKYSLWHGEISIFKKSSIMNEKITIETPLITQTFEREEEGYTPFAKRLTKKELKRWRRKYNRETLVIKNQQTESFNKQVTSNYLIIPKLDTTIQHKRRVLDITEQREIPAESKQLRKPDSLGTTMKDALYLTLNKSIKKKSRKATIF